MSYHLDKQRQFQSDQYPYHAPDEIVLSFKDPAAMEALYIYADLMDDDDLAVAIVKRLDAVAEEYVQVIGRLEGSALCLPGQDVERFEYESLSG